MTRAIAGTAAWAAGAGLEARCRALAQPLGLNPKNSFAVASDHQAFCGATFPRSSSAVSEGRGDRFAPELKIVGDVRIDNRGAFVARCGLSPDSGIGLSDVEMIALAWSRCEERIFDALAGPYALAIWCGRRQRLFLVRDPQGLRPLFFHCNKDWVAFASLPNALAVLPEVGRRLNRRRMLELLLLVDPQGNPGFYDGIEAVRKGEIVCFDGPARIVRRRFWDPRDVAIERRRPDEYAEGLRERLSEAVRAAIDTPQTIATTLSGGFDSGAVTSLAARMLRRDDRSLLAYTATPAAGDPTSISRRWMDDEFELAAAVVRRHPNIRHRAVAPQAASLTPLFDFFFDHVGAPCLTPVVFHWYGEIERQAVADGAEILLTATGGNGTISYHGAPFLLQLAEQGRWLTLLQWLLRLRGGHPALRRGDLLRKLLRRQLGEAGWERLRRLAGRRARQSWTAQPPDWSPVAAERLPEYLTGIDRRAPQFEILHGGLGRGSDRRDFLMRETTLPLYEKAVWLQRGLDKRDPTLDRRVVEFCLSIPDEEFLRGGKDRAVFRRAFGQELPPETLANDRIGRQGYGGHRNLLRSAADFRDEIDRVAEHSPDRALFDLAGLSRLVEDIPAEDDGSNAVDIAYTRKLSRGISALHFANRMGPGN